MRETDQQQLRHELRHVGASKAEIQTLLPVASKLEQLKSMSLPAIEERKPRRFRLKYARGFTLAVVAVAAVFILIAIAQSVSPTNALYPLQKLSDNVAISMHPPYRANVMMKRAQQVNALVAFHASTQQVLAVLSDYDAEAKAYKSMPHANYAAFEFCKTNLQQAAASAPPQERQAILSSLKPLNET